MSDSKTQSFVIEPVEPRRHFDSGFTASYFPATTFTGRAITREDAAIAFNFGRTAPAKGIDPKHFSARWTGQLIPTSDGRHAVYVTTEGGVRMWINHTLVLNKWAAPGTPTNYKIVTRLTENRLADIQIEYRHDSGRGSIGVTWVRPGGAKEVLAGSGVTPRAMMLADQIDHGRTFAADQLGTTFRTLKTKDGAPIRSEPAKPDWLRSPFTDWTSGTFAGSMWEVNKTFAGWDKMATTWTTPLADVKIVGDAFDREWAAYKPLYDATGDAGAKQILLASAKLKMTAWNKTVRAFKTPELVSTSGNRKANFGVLMDQTNDMAELLWAGEQTGDPSYRDRVIAHMQTVAKNMVRADGSVFQRGYFDAATSKFVVGENYQGYSNTSTWSRAQAWAIRSFADVATATGDGTIFETAKKVADYYFSHAPDDGVPYWDFNAPKIPNTYRDTSAAAITASGLIRLSKLIPDPLRIAYRSQAEKVLRSLLGPSYLAEGSAVKGIMQHGAANVPKNKGVDASLMFGDYYLLQAMNDYTSSS